GYMNPTLPLLKGTLDLLILKSLSWGELHGYGIASWLERQSGGTLGVDDSALYQALHRLEARGLVEAEWGVTETNRKARYYELTVTGRQRLRKETATWLKYTASVTEILSLTSPAK
ncbi:MAG: PadR family transcriptional regulator, partial [Longimicrobiales bacterium]